MTKKYVGAALALAICLAGINGAASPAEAKAIIYNQSVVHDGVMLGPIEVGGMTKEEAEAAVNAYIDELRKTNITLALDGAGEEKKIDIMLEELGFSWANPEVLSQALNMGKKGNIVKRYKIQKDISNSQTSFELKFNVDDSKVRAVLEAHLGELQAEAANAALTKTETGFSITDESVGKSVDMEASLAAVKEYLLNQWNYQEVPRVILVSEDTLPAVTRADIEKIQPEPMASFTTSYSSSGSSRSANIDVAVQKINGTILMPGQQFSCLEHMVPFTAENGYYPAGSYYNGMLVDSYGGGVCQVSTTLYNAVILAELEVNKRYNHGLTVGYVQLSSDAAIAESSGMDLIFTNNTNAPIYIEGYTKNKKVTFQIYGMDERPGNRTIEYKNKVVEVIQPPEDVLTEDPNLPAGTRTVTQSSHTGYRAELYKYVYVDGVQTSVEKVNSSYYAPAPNYITVGPGVVNAEGQEETSSSVDVPADVQPAEPEGTQPPEGQPVQPGGQPEPVPETEPVTEPETAVGSEGSAGPV